MSLERRSGGSVVTDPDRWVIKDEIPVTNPSVFAVPASLTPNPAALLPTPLKGNPGTGKSSCSYGPRSGW